MLALTSRARGPGKESPQARIFKDKEPQNQSTPLYRCWQTQYKTGPVSEKNCIVAETVQTITPGSLGLGTQSRMNIKFVEFVAGLYSELELKVSKFTKEFRNSC